MAIDISVDTDNSGWRIKVETMGNVITKRIFAEGGQQYIRFRIGDKGYYEGQAIPAALEMCPIPGRNRALCIMEMQGSGPLVHCQLTSWERAFYG